MHLRRIALALSSLVLYRCDSTATCPDCREPALEGLTLEAPAQAPIGSCTPVQIAYSDASRAREDLAVNLGGDVTWYANGRCSIAASTVTLRRDERVAIAYVLANRAGDFKARAQKGALGGQVAISIKEPTGSATSLRLSGARYGDVGKCLPLWLTATTSDGAPATPAGSVDVSITGDGVQLFDNDNCSIAATSTVLDATHTWRAAYVSFGLPGTIAVEASSSSLSGSNLAVNIEGEPLARLTFVPSDDTIAVQAGECRAITIAIVDSTGRPLAIDSTAVTLEGQGASTFSDATCAVPVDSVTISGTAPRTFYVQATLVGNAAISAGIGSAPAQTLSLVVAAGTPAKLQLSGATRLSQTGCYRYSVRRTDAYGNPTAGAAQAVSLTAAAGLATYSDATCATAASTASIAVTASTAAFYLQGTAPLTDAALTASATGLSSATAIVDVVDAASKLAVVLPAQASAGDCVRLDVLAHDAADIETDVLAAENVSVVSNDASVKVFADAACTLEQTSTTLAALTRRTAVYVSGTVVGDYQITVSGTALTAAPVEPLEVIAGAPVRMEWAGNERINLATCTTLSVRVFDSFGNRAPVPSAVTLSTTSSAGSAFYTSASCGSGSGQTILAPGTSSADVYYRGDFVGADTLTATATNLGSATLSVSVTVALADVNADIADAALFRELTVDPNDDALIWAMTLDGMVWRSADAGASWVKYCSIGTTTIDASGEIIVSPAADATAYITASNVRVDALDGAACPRITNTLGTIFTYYTTSGLTVDHDGELFAWVWSTPVSLHRSTDRGATWSLVFQDTNTAWMGFMAHSPFDGNLKLVDRTFTGGAEGLYRSTNGGSSFSFVTNAGFADSLNPIRFDPAHTGWVYKYGRYSNDNGLTWTSSSAYNFAYSWAIDGTGAAFSFDTSQSATTVVRRAPDARSPVWAALEDGVFDEDFDSRISTVSVSNSGQTIGVLTGAAAYLSTNGGAEFNRLSVPGTAHDYVSVVVSSSASTSYALTTAWTTFATIDGGATWALMQSDAIDGLPMIHVNPEFPETVYVRAEEFNSTYNATVWSTQDAFATLIDAPNGARSSWASTGAVSLADPLVFYVLGSGARRTLDGGTTYTDVPTSVVASVWYPAPIAYVSPVDNNRVWFAGGQSGGALSELDATTGLVTDITSRTGIRPAAIEMYKTGSTYILRAAGRDGALVVSSDLTASFGTPSAASGDSQCEQRLLSSLPGNPQVVTTACVSSSTIAVSKNNGATWTVYPVSGCRLHQLSVVQGAVIASCASTAVRTVQY